MLINLSDKELLLHEDDRAFRILYDRYWQVLYKKAIARLRNEDDAKDILQEIFISIWNNRQQIKFEETLGPYIFTALKYSIIKKVERDLKKGITHPLNIEDVEKVHLTNEEILQYKELSTIINRAVSHLPSRMKEVYNLSRQDHLKNREIAERLNLSEQTVKNILGAAMKKLRTKLVEYQFSMFIF